MGHKIINFNNTRFINSAYLFVLGSWHSNEIFLFISVKTNTH